MIRAYTVLFLGVFISAQALARPQQKWMAPDGSGDDRFGCSVAIEQDIAVVGASQAAAGGPLSGTAYVYSRGETGWHQTQQLEEAAAGEGFGSAVAIDGNTLAVGAPGGNAVYVYTRYESTWSLQQKLTRPVGDFGIALDIDGDTLVVGASEGCGTAYIYTRSGTTWTRRKQLTAPVPDPLPGLNDKPHYGRAVAIDNGTVVIGAYHYSYDGLTFSGAAWVYTGSGADWTLLTELTRLVEPHLEPTDCFGKAVAIDGDTILVASPRDDCPACGIGSVYIFHKTGSHWHFHQKLAAPDPMSWYFGCAVAVQGKRAVIGAEYANLGDGRTGGLYEYVSDGSTWQPRGSMAAGADCGNLDWFGHAVALSEEYLLAGAYTNDNENGTDAGAAYLFEICDGSLAGDLNFDCRVDLTDLIEMADHWLIDCLETPEHPACIPR